MVLNFDSPTAMTGLSVCLRTGDMSELEDEDKLRPSEYSPSLYYQGDKDSSPDSDQGNKVSLYLFFDVPGDEFEWAKDLLAHVYPFTQVKILVSKNLCFKKKENTIGVDKVALKALIRKFVVYLISLQLCFNTRKDQHSKCTCINKLQDHDRDVAYLLTVTLMTKKELDDIYKEIING
jgi:hypothetical protein